MADFPLSLNTNEKILRIDEQAIHVKANALGIGYNVIFGSLWLTSQRLVFRSAFLGNTLTYPLSRISNAERIEATIYQKTSQYSSQTYDSALFVEFDNHGKEYFIPEDIQGWAKNIKEAKTFAPDLPFTQLPPSTSSIEQGNKGLSVILGIMFGIVILFLCSVFVCVGLPFLMAVLRGSSI